jgi:hypothetical protein
LPLGPVQLLDLAQKAIRLLAALLPFLSFDGGVVTAVFNLLPGFLLLYAATPFDVIPAPDLTDLL